MVNCTVDKRRIVKSRYKSSHSADLLACPPTRIRGSQGCGTATSPRPSSQGRAENYHPLGDDSVSAVSFLCSGICEQRAPEKGGENASTGRRETSSLLGIRSHGGAAVFTYSSHPILGLVTSGYCPWHKARLFPSLWDRSPP